MKKFEELIDLINTKHPEWKNLTVRGLNKNTQTKNEQKKE